MIRRALCAAGDGDDGDGLALRRPRSVVQVVEAARQALVEGLGGAQRHDVVLAEREAAGEEGAGLCRLIELELVVGRDVSGPALRVVGRAVLQRDDERSLFAAFCPFLYHVVSQLSDV